MDWSVVLTHPTWDDPHWRTAFVQDQSHWTILWLSITPVFFNKDGSKPQKMTTLTIFWGIQWNQHEFLQQLIIAVFSARISCSSRDARYVEAWSKWFGPKPEVKHKQHMPRGRRELAISPKGYVAATDFPCPKKIIQARKRIVMVQKLGLQYIITPIKVV